VVNFVDFSVQYSIHCCCHWYKKYKNQPRNARVIMNCHFMVHGIEEVCLSTIHNIWPMLTNGSRLGNRDKHHIDMSQSPERTMKAW